MPTRRLGAELVERQRLVDEGVLPAELVAAPCDAALRVVESLCGFTDVVSVAEARLAG